MPSLSAPSALLDWATQNTPNKDDPNYEPPRPLEKLDPGLIDMILGKPDAVRMKEVLAIALDETESEDARVQALDDLELLVESLDNANDMEALKLWQPVLSLAESGIPTIATQALWVLGTAVQNNPASQDALLKYNPFPILVRTISKSNSNEARSKALYCLSGLLKHNRLAILQFSKAGGWGVLKLALYDSSNSVRRKTAFLLNSLLIPISSEPNAPSDIPSNLDTSDLTRAGVSFEYIVSALTSSVANPPGGISDEDYEEKAMRAVVTFLQGEPVGTRADEDDTSTVKDDLGVLLKERDTERGKSWNLDKDDWGVLRQHARIKL